ncbi:hypothetical protein CXB51_031178 [Gossypium anomalum]|uniref:Protein Lines C-terminal domain-containing protein n=1 Tax=Gossypium anomalum TaxID=47600 RepID=A0A8J6CJH2_9ROSI|nr:hypothetical protein CXB51_031178 [Gossypium anomalum]
MGKKMSSPSLTESQFIRICRLINDSLHPFTVSENLSFSKQEEKNLLLILSQVSNEIRRLIPSADTSSPLNPNSQNHHCLSKSISHLIPLLTLESLYIQHLAGNVLVTFSEFLASSVKTWEFFIHSLSICLELSISNISSCSFEPSITEAGGSGSDLLNLVGLFKSKLKNTSLFTVAGIIRTLRNILKFLKEECDDELVLVLLNSISFFISNVPWDSMDEIFGGNGGEDDERNTLFLGNFIQLLSSFVDQISFAEGLDDSLDKNVILSKIINLVPKLLYWCLRKEGKCVNTCISRYFSHKLLVLMIRLSLQIPLDFLVLVSWLQLLHRYFEDLLYQPLTDVMNQDDSLEDSPFMLSNFDGEVHSMHSRHLQRQAIFLFLRCSFSLINLGKATRKHYSSATVKSSIDVDAISEQSCYGREKGLLELYAWLSGHVLVDKLVAHEMYREKSINFSFSLLKLYTHEDDILFKFLLELLSLQACEEQQFHKERLAPQDEMEDVLFHVSYIFNPIRLFHLFLAEASLLHPNLAISTPGSNFLHYDHQVLLDYLISKDTGISCAEYLLRCLRIVCDSWQTFMEFSVYGKLSNQLSSKRRKILSESSNFKIELSSRPVKMIPLSLEKKFNGNLEYRHTKQMYELAKGCLLSLKKSVENLHLKNLFPYNPEVLLKRLERFQELCFKQ